MMWPFGKREKRESSFTDALLTQILGNATGASLALPTATGALETCSGLIARAFAVAEVQGPEWARAALTPACLAMIGRALIRQGEIVLVIDGDGGGLQLFPVSDHDVQGGVDPAGWLYRVTMPGPSILATRDGVSAAGVIHVRYSQDPGRPWRGISPLQSAALAGRLSAETAKALADEASGPRGALLPMPGKDGEDDTVTAFKADLRNLNGAMALVESTSSLSPDRSMSQEWRPVRLGANMPDALVELASQASREILAVHGISPALFDATAGASAREGYRQFLHSVIAPLGKLVAGELSEKLEADIALDWRELKAGDIAGRARAFQSMVGAGMDITKAASLAGLMVADD